MPTRALTNLEYMVDQDSSATFESPPLDLTYPFVAVNYQFKWEVGVTGKFTWYATIFPDLWEPLVACEEVTFTIDGTEELGEEHNLISLPCTWLNSGYIKFVWVPEETSVGMIDVASRIVPT